jgi:hypothetical protein
MEMEWHRLFESWTPRALERIRRRGPTFTPSEQDVLRAARLTRGGASRRNLEDAERRLGITFPASYRTFLEFTDGAFDVNDALTSRLLSVSEIGWFRDLEPEMCAIWSDPLGLDPVPDEIYFVYGPEQDDALIRREYVRGCLLVSEPVVGEVYLLNPAVEVIPDEWEAWDLSAQRAGVQRYRSFGEMLLAHSRPSSEKE